MTGTGGRRSAAGDGNAAVKQCIIGIDGAKPPIFLEKCTARANRFCCFALPRLRSLPLAPRFYLVRAIMRVPPAYKTPNFSAISRYVFLYGPLYVCHSVA